MAWYLVKPRDNCTFILPLSSGILDLLDLLDSSLLSNSIG